LFYQELFYIHIILPIRYIGLLLVEEKDTEKIRFSIYIL